MKEDFDVKNWLKESGHMGTSEGFEDRLMTRISVENGQKSYSPVIPHSFWYVMVPGVILMGLMLIFRSQFKDIEGITEDVSHFWTHFRDVIAHIPSYSDIIPTPTGETLNPIYGYALLISGFFIIVLSYWERWAHHTS